MQPKTLPNKGELLSEEDLTRVLPKIPHEEDAQSNDDDRAMADFVIHCIYYDCLSIPDDFIYEVMENNTKKFRNVHAYESKQVYRLLAAKMISTVGDYYQCLRQRPNKKAPACEYIPNNRYAYKVVKHNLAQLGITVLPS
jgi:hypothetical protein